MTHSNSLSFSCSSRNAPCTKKTTAPCCPQFQPTNARSAFSTSSVIWSWFLDPSQHSFFLPKWRYSREDYRPIWPIPKFFVSCCCLLHIRLFLIVLQIVEQLLSDLVILWEFELRFAFATSLATRLLQNFLVDGCFLLFTENKLSVDGAGAFRRRCWSGNWYIWLEVVKKPSTYFLWICQPNFRTFEVICTWRKSSKLGPEGLSASNFFRNGWKTVWRTQCFLPPLVFFTLRCPSALCSKVAQCARKAGRYVRRKLISSSVSFLGWVDGCGEGDRKGECDAECDIERFASESQVESSANFPDK